MKNGLVVGSGGLAREFTQWISSQIEKEENSRRQGVGIANTLLSMQ
jgi:hypothetical protein